MLITYKTGNIKPINEMGQKYIGLIYGDKYEISNNNKLIELNRYNIFSINDNWFIYFFTKKSNEYIPYKPGDYCEGTIPYFNIVLSFFKYSLIDTGIPSLHTSKIRRRRSSSLSLSTSCSTAS